MIDRLSEAERQSEPNISFLSFTFILLFLLFASPNYRERHYLLSHFKYLIQIFSNSIHIFFSALENGDYSPRQKIVDSQNVENLQIFQGGKNLLKAAKIY